VKLLHLSFSHQEFEEGCNREQGKRDREYPCRIADGFVRDLQQPQAGTGVAGSVGSGKGGDP
jgi:hypothetical protein